MTEKDYDMTNIDALLNASILNSLFFNAYAPFVARVSMRHPQDDSSFTVEIDAVYTDGDGYLPRRNVATLSDINDSCYSLAGTIIRAWDFTRNPVSL